MEKRLILAIALSVLIVVTFQFLSPKPVTVPPREAASPVAAEPAKDAGIIQQVTPSVEEKELEAETGTYILTFSNIGGAIKKIRLKDFKASNSTENLDLVKLTNPAEYLLNISSVTNTDIDNALYSSQVSGETVTYILRTGDLEITKRYTLYKSKHGIGLDILVKNISGSSKQFSYRIIGGAGISEVNNQDKRFVEVTADINGKTLGFKRPKPGQRIINLGIVGWSTLKNKYFSLVLKPFISTKSQFYSEGKSGALVMGIDTDAVTIQPNSFIDNKFVLYAGPSSIPALKELNYGLETTVNYGFFGGISKVMITVMGFFHLVTRSWGFSIILLSVFLNIILFPLTVKSFKSMQKMQELHPQMEQLKKQYKDSPDKLNKAIMELYKKYKINPLSGCLPILLQMPIFIALYSALMKSIELRNASFFWIRDLSSPDAVRLPFTLPLIGNSINILPIIMVAAMVMQQKISTKTMGSAVTAEQKEQQKMMLIIMPIVFGFIFYSMPSGLVLYWVVNTLLTITEQASLAKNS
ncbi:MAG: membrane protein insertase YidC [Candidatus Omnitrophica bacterium]|nr:membrane protein insertase YidC [Candidatus Omnitrophota bacterium]